MLYKLLNITETQYTELVNWIDEACVDEDEFIEFIQEQAKELERCLWELCLPVLFLEYVANKANVEELIPYVTEEDEEITYRIEPEEAMKLLMQVPEDDRNPAWFFLVDFLTLDLSEEV